MGRYVAGALCWAALAAINYPSAPCLGDTPSEATMDSPAETSTEPKPLFKYENYPAAWSAAQESNKPILVYVSMPDCPHCTKMLESTYACSDVSEIVKGSFETLEVSRHTHAVLVEKLHIKWYPSTVLVGSNNKVLDLIEGYVDSEAFKRRLQLGIASASNNTQTR